MKAEFLKGTKRSVSDYPELKDDKYWMDFKEDVESIIATHGCRNVLDSLYVPSRNESPLFKEQQAFVYSVFKAKLKTLKSKLVLQKFTKSKNAQDLWEALINDYEKGTTGKLSNEDLEDKWKNFKLDDRWSRSYESFLNNWSTCLNNYETAWTKTLMMMKEKSS